jgi:NADPH:quinone reductase-like Zn-dependent oxidoreductase
VDEAPEGFKPSHPQREAATMQVAGIREIGAPVEMIEVSEPRPLAPDEVLVEVAAAGVGNWDEFVRTGGWDVGGGPPTALGVEAAGTVLAVGDAVVDWSPGDEVMTHPLPLRNQGTWAPQLIAPAALLARKPANATWEAAAAFPVPALTAEQVIGEALDVHAGEQLLVHGAGGVTGGLLVALGTLRGAQVIATAGQASRQRVSALGAHHVIDYHDRDWPEQVRAITEGRGVPAAVNAVPGYAADAIHAVADNGRLATITSDPPAEERGITVSNVYVRPDGDQLRKLAEQFVDGRLVIPIASTYPLADAAAALAQTISGHAGGAIILKL